MRIDNTMLEDIWFTADNHFGHENIIQYCKRPFESVDVMDKALIDNWNKVIKPGDTVYHLGDFTLGDWKQAEFYFKQLNGQIKILSNPWHHDKRWLKKLKDFPEDAYVNRLNNITESFELLPPMTVLEIENMGASEYPLAITLCHYPLAVWDRKHYGAWHLHGHTHKRNYSVYEFVLNVGVDCMNYYPISLGGVLQCMYEKGHV